METGRFISFGNRMICSRYSPTLPVMREMRSEHQNRKAQEPRITAYVSQDPKMIKSFQEGKDIYASIASVAFKVPYEQCLEFNPITGENQPEGKKRRNQSKFIVLGITYGRSVPSIADQLYGKDKNMSDDDKVKEAQKVYDAVLNAFPNLRSLMLSAQKYARDHGFVETVLGRRRHIPDMTLPEFEFSPMRGYVNPDIDPLDPSTLDDKNKIPQRVVDSLMEEFKQYKYYGQIARRIRELYELEHIRVTNNRPKITDASRRCVNCVDYDTEILTDRGWLRYDEVKTGDKVLSYSLDSHEIVEDKVKAVFNYPGDTEVVHFNTPTFSAMSTMDHRWVVGESDELPRIKLTRNIYNNKWPDYPILRVGDNSFEANPNLSDDELKVLGWIMTDGSIGRSGYAIHLYQSTRKEKNRIVYNDMVDTLERLGVSITDACRDGYYHEIYLKCNPFLKYVYTTFPDRVLSFEFVSTLSQHQCEVLMRAMLQGDGSGVDGYGYPLHNSRVSLCCKGELNRDIFQYICFRAGYATNSITIDGSTVDYPSNHILYSSMTNVPVSDNIYYDICVLRVQRAQVYPHHKSIEHVDGVWCVSTGTGSWVARRNGKVYITGNSIIQGSAADQTKLAILLLENNEEWKNLGGRLLVPVHDELICEVPMDNWKEGGELLSKIMCDAADFLPFPSKCDVTTTLRWYGLEYPCPYKMPESISDIENMNEDEIKWIQYHLVELEYILPVFKEADGSSPQGDAAVGVNGRYSDDMMINISDYIETRRITESEFVKCICDEVRYGQVKR